MWFISTKTKIPKFYSLAGELVEANVAWTYEKLTPRGLVTSSEPMAQDPDQAIRALQTSGAATFSTKSEARVFAKGLPQGSWKYYSIT